MENTREKQERFQREAELFRNRWKELLEKLVVFHAFAELYHYESKSRGMENTREKQERFQREAELFRNRWKELLEEGDPYYNPNLTLEHSDCSLKW